MYLNLSNVMAVIDKVETNTETEPNSGNILHKSGVVCQGQKLEDDTFEILITRISGPYGPLNSSPIGSG